MIAVVFTPATFGIPGIGPVIVIVCWIAILRRQLLARRDAQLPIGHFRGE